MDLSRPVFAEADNPASTHPDAIVRLLTFLYLPVVNVVLLLFPWQLSFDWSMDSIPLVLSVNDPRNVCTCLLYSSLICISVKIMTTFLSRAESGLKNPVALKYDSRGATRQGAVNGLPGSSSLNPHLNASYWQERAKHSCSFDCRGQNGKLLHCCNGDKSPQQYIGRQTSNGLKTNDFSCLHAELNNPRGRSNANVNEMLIRSYDNWHKCVTRNGACHICCRDDDDGLGPSAALVSLSILVIPFVPASNLFFYVGFVVAERLLYIPSMGFCLLVALGFGKLSDNHRSLRKAIKIGLFIVIGLFCLRTYLRNEVWKDEESLYRFVLLVFI